MNKRSAMLMAAGLVLAMVVAGVAISAGLTGPSASAAAPRTSRHHHPKPIVKTVRTTQTIHRKAPASSATVVRTTSAAPAMYSPVSSPSAASYAFDDHGSPDDGGSHGSGGGDD